MVMFSIKFQSTHPCGVRMTQLRLRLQCHSFNPRTRVGCEVATVYAEQFASVSIHAPVWGANVIVGFFAVFVVAFQSTHPCGVRIIVLR